MTNLPDDHIDPYESRLTRRVGAFADQAVRPIDASAIASAARAGARRQTLAGRLFGSTSSMNRLGVVLAGALVAAVAFGVFVNAGGGNLFGPNQTIGPSQTIAGPVPTPTDVPSTAGPVATPTEVPGAAEPCAADVLTGMITAWDGAAGHRIATVIVHNGGKVDCLLPVLLRPALVDADGHALIVGEPASDSSSIDIPGGADVTTMVDMANYCGAAPTSALRIRLYLPDQSSVEAAAAGSLSYPLDTPPCNGPNQPAEIQMQALSLKK